MGWVTSGERLLKTVPKRVPDRMPMLLNFAWKKGKRREIGKGCVIDWMLSTCWNVSTSLALPPSTENLFNGAMLAHGFATVYVKTASSSHNRSFIMSAAVQPNPTSRESRRSSRIDVGWGSVGFETRKLINEEESNYSASQLVVAGSYGTDFVATCVLNCSVWEKIQQFNEAFGDGGWELRRRRSNDIGNYVIIVHTYEAYPVFLAYFSTSKCNNCYSGQIHLIFRIWITKTAGE